MESSIYARISNIKIFLPDQILTNEELAELYPDWSAEKIYEKTGIRERRIAAAHETACDLGYQAARRLFESGAALASEIDFIILCTQAPDYILPSTACILQDRLGIPKTSGAFDINLGCSGYVYGLSIAKGLIETGSAKCILFVTADTYSKYINPLDKSVRTLFGDAATATLIRGSKQPEPQIGPFVFGTDGSGAKDLIVEAGLFRRPKDAETSLTTTDHSGNVRSAENLYMNGANVMNFSLREVPRAVDCLLEKARISKDDVDYFVFHQANSFMLNALQRKLRIPKEKMPLVVEKTGNTVSSTIPLALNELDLLGDRQHGKKAMLVGFGVGLSWAACLTTL